LRVVLACPRLTPNVRSAHQALQSLHTAVMGQGLRWVIDIDIVKYFDSIPHSQLRDFLDHAASLSSSLNDDFSILDRALQHLCRRPWCPVTRHNSDRFGDFGSYTKNL